MKKPKGYWNDKDNITKEAARYESRQQFRFGNKHVYERALKLGMMDSLFDLSNYKAKFWTVEKLFECASQFSSMGEIYSANKYVWEKLRERGLDVELFPNEKKKRLGLTNDEVVEICSQYQSIGELQTKDASIYNTVNRRGIRGTAFAHMKNQGSSKDKQVYIIKNDVSVYVGTTTNPYNRLAQHKRKQIMTTTFGKDFTYEWLSVVMDYESALTLESELISKLSSEGFKMVNKNAGNASGSKTVKWTRDRIIEESMNYKSVNDMRLKNNGLRCAIVRNGMVSEINDMLCDM